MNDWLDQGRQIPSVGVPRGDRGADGKAIEVILPRSIRACL